jgi:hypothetical protein
MEDFLPYSFVDEGLHGVLFRSLRQSETMVVVVVGGWVGLVLALTGAVLLMGSSVIIGRDDDCEQSVVDD